MPYRDRLNGWLVVRLLPKMQRVVVSRFRNHSEADEDLLEQDPTVQAEIQEAKIAYQTGDYQTIDQYITKQSGKTP